jgi:hypothetical protein
MAMAGWWGLCQNKNMHSGHIYVSMMPWCTVFLFMTFIPNPQLWSSIMVHPLLSPHEQFSILVNCSVVHGNAISLLSFTLQV